jgi:hypothetical protein
VLGSPSRGGVGSSRLEAIIPPQLMMVKYFSDESLASGSENSGVADFWYGRSVSQCG